MQQTIYSSIYCPLRMLKNLSQHKEKAIRYVRKIGVDS